MPTPFSDIEAERCPGESGRRSPIILEKVEDDIQTYWRSSSTFSKIIGARILVSSGRLEKPEYDPQ
jgi:hypothetical protein